MNTQMPKPPRRGIKSTIPGRSLILLLLPLLLAPATLFGQQDSRYDAGLNLPFNEKAGDVNPQTGNIVLRAADLILPGRAGMDFRFGRLWALNQSQIFTMYRDPVDGSNKLSGQTLEGANHLGVGWSASLPYLHADTSSGQLVVNLFFDGNVYEVDQSGIQVKNLSKSNLLGYDLLDLRIYRDAGIAYSDFSRYDLTQLKQEYPIADQGTDRSAYLLLRKDNSKYWFREDGRLMMREDRTGLNEIWYFYDFESKLLLAVDTVGRKIRFKYDQRDNLIAVEWDIKVGRKDPLTGKRSYQEETRSIQYTYQSAESYPETKRFKDEGRVIDYREPYVLREFIDALGNVTTYEWQEGVAGFTYDSKKSHSETLYLLLSGIVENHNPGDGKYKSKRYLEYEVPAKGMYTKYFYGGYLEHYRISRQYRIDRHGRIMNDTRYVYHDKGEAGNYNQYSAVVERGNVRTTYTYSLSNMKNQDHVLDNLLVETVDGFRQLTDYAYTMERAKALEEVFRQGSFAYREKFQFDPKGNLKRHEDRQGLVTVKEYDDTYSIPVREARVLQVQGVEKTYEREWVINELGQVIKELVYVEQPGGGKQAIAQATIDYDAYGNPVARTDALGNTVHTVYDVATHALPIKEYTDVTVGAWSSGGGVQQEWLEEPDSQKTIRVRNWKVFNTDGRPWIEIDSQGYAVEHYYDALGSEVETVNPDEDDERGFAGVLEVVNGAPVGDDFDDFLASPYYAPFLLSRENNPGVRREIDYQEEFVKTFTDLDLALGQVKVTGVQKDGLGNVEEEIEYGPGGGRYGVKRMHYDSLGRMIGLTDPDAGPEYTLIRVNGSLVERHDKTWVVKYDDLGRTIKVLYPETEPGRSDVKHIRYEDAENSRTLIDPEGRRVYERRDWNENLVEVIAYGDGATPAEAVQKYTYTYDMLNRRTEFQDPQGNLTRYGYEERDLVVEQIYGDSGKEVMAYDERGQLVKKVDRKGQVSAYQYDELGRNTRVDYYRSEGDYGSGTADETVRTLYDQRGNPLRVSNKHLIEHYVYDHSSRVIKLERRLKEQGLREVLAGVWGGPQEAQVFGFAYHHNAAGMVVRMDYPDGSAHRFRYDGALGRLIGIEERAESSPLNEFIKEIYYDRAGVVTRMEHANGVVQEWDFDNRKRIAEIRIHGPNAQAPVLEALHYRLNSVGDILGINDHEYGYDGFDRIMSAKTLLPGKVDLKKRVMKHFGTYGNGGQIDGIGYNAEADVYPVALPDGRINGADHLHCTLMDTGRLYDEEAFEYDRNGNRVRLVQNGDEYTYSYGIRNRLEQIRLKKQGETAPKLFAEYGYDANGNLIRRVVHQEAGEQVTAFTYDALNRLVKTVEAGAQTEYYYDGAGNRFIKKGPEGEVTLYLRHGQIAVAMDVELPAATETEYLGKINRYVLSGDLLAGRITTTVNPDHTETVTKSNFHLDHLNSTKLVTDATGAVEVRYEYRAFGQQLAKLGEGEATYTYSGKELDEGTDLYYFNARYYDPSIGRFITLDPIQDGTNFYIYASNNPLSITDPTGLEIRQKAVRREMFSLNTAAIRNVRDQMHFAIDRDSKIGFKDIAPMLLSVIPKVSETIGNFFGFDALNTKERVNLNNVNAHNLNQVLDNLSESGTLDVNLKYEGKVDTQVFYGNGYPQVYDKASVEAVMNDPDSQFHGRNIPLNATDDFLSSFDRMEGKIKIGGTEPGFGEYTSRQEAPPIQHVDELD